MFFIEIIKRTPVYAWIILAVLILRGINSAKENIISFPKMFLIPAVFAVWGLYDLLTGFGYPITGILFYCAAAIGGTAAGFAIYTRCRSVFRKDGMFYRTGTYVPLFIMMVNFLVKYILNVAVSISPKLYTLMNFNILYSVICGFSVGLFLGGILQVYRSVWAYDKS